MFSSFLSRENYLNYTQYLCISIMYKTPNITIILLYIYNN